MPPVMQIFIAIIIISAVVGAVAQLLSKMNVPQNQPNRRPIAERNRAGGAVRQSNNDVDRFLAEIDRLRQRNEPPATAPANRAGTQKPKSRPIATPVQPPPRSETQPQPQQVSSAYDLPASPIFSHQAMQSIEELPVASVIASSSSVTQPARSPQVAVVTMAPPSRSAPMTPRAIATRRSTPTSDFGRHLLTLLGSKEGVPMAVVMTEILGKPKSRG